MRASQLESSFNSASSSRQVRKTTQGPAGCKSKGNQSRPQMYGQGKWYVTEHSLENEGGEGIRVTRVLNAEYTQQLSTGIVLR